MTRSHLTAVLLFATACGPRQWTGDPRPLDHIIARSDQIFGDFNGVRVLSDGRVLITDDAASRLWLLDKDLKNGRVVADTTNRLYFHPGLYIRPYLGDSTILSQAPRNYVLILDEQARPVRGVPFVNGPRTGDQWTGDMLGAQFTKRGEIMVLDVKRMTVRERDAARAETVYVVRTSFAAPQRRDTVGMFTRELPRLDRSLPEGTSQFGWFLRGDAAGMLADGTIGIVRSSDYHIDWIDRAGKRWSTSIPQQWVVLTQAGKRQILDSLYAAARHIGFSIQAKVQDNRGTFTAVPTDSSVVTATIADLPDTVPAVRSVREVMADADGHLWIEKLVVRTNPYGVVPGRHYDVVDRNGRLVRKVVLPSAAQL